VTPAQCIKHLKCTIPNGPWEVIVVRDEQVVIVREFGPASETAAKRFIAKWHEKENEGFLTFLGLAHEPEAAVEQAHLIARREGQVILCAVDAREIAKKREVVQ
jgi:hypothetical protein